MELKEVKSIMSAYGFQPSFDPGTLKNFRFQGESTFIDLWDTKRGLTLGIYVPHLKRMRYVRPKSMGELEDQLIEITK